jgi:hypothetical protein
MYPIRQMIIRAYIGAAVISVFIALLGSLLHRRATSFESLAQGYEMLRARGYHCIGDRHDGKIEGSFIVSRDRLTWNDVASMYMAGPMGPNWKGRAWVIRKSATARQYTSPGDAMPRVWGSLWAFGDEELLDEIEQSLFQ